MLNWYQFINEARKAKPKIDYKVETERIVSLMRNMIKSASIPEDDIHDLIIDFADDNDLVPFSDENIPKEGKWIDCYKNHVGMDLNRLDDGGDEEFGLDGTWLRDEDPEESYDYYKDFIDYLKFPKSNYVYTVSWVFSHIKGGLKAYNNELPPVPLNPTTRKKEYLKNEFEKIILNFKPVKERIESLHKCLAKMEVDQSDGVIIFTIYTKIEPINSDEIFPWRKDIPISIKNDLINFIQRTNLNDGNVAELINIINKLNPKPINEAAKRDYASEMNKVVTDIRKLLSENNIEPDSIYDLLIDTADDYGLSKKGVYEDLIISIKPYTIDSLNNGTGYAMRADDISNKSSSISLRKVVQKYDLGMDNLKYQKFYKALSLDKYDLFYKIKFDLLVFDERNSNILKHIKIFDPYAQDKRTERAKEFNKIFENDLQRLRSIFGEVYLTQRPSNGPTNEPLGKYITLEIYIKLSKEGLNIPEKEWQKQLPENIKREIIQFVGDTNLSDKRAIQLVNIINKNLNKV